jgi:hypothetical protein
MKRKLKWLALVLAVALLGFGTALLLWPRDRITVESWQKIRIGMTEDEVAEILGGPGMTNEEALRKCHRLENELGQRPFEFEDPSLEEPNGVFAHQDRLRIWAGRRGIILIELDQDNNVCWKQFLGARWTNQGILDRLRDWLGW